MLICLTSAATRGGETIASLLRVDRALCSMPVVRVLLMPLVPMVSLIAVKSPVAATAGLFPARLLRAGAKKAAARSCKNTDHFAEVVTNLNFRCEETPGAAKASTTTAPPIRVEE